MEEESVEHHAGGFNAVPEEPRLGENAFMPPWKASG